jgi:hypothetical protein
MADPPDWTDFNESDPGITLLELFAFVAVAYFFLTRLRPLLEAMGLVKRVVTVEVAGKPWSQVETLEDASPDAGVYHLDAESGSIQFGDGLHGGIPSGSVNIASRYRYGAGAVGAIGTILVLCGLWSISICRRCRRRRKP